MQTGVEYVEELTIMTWSRSTCMQYSTSKNQLDKSYILQVEKTLKMKKGVGMALADKVMKQGIGM